MRLLICLFCSIVYVPMVAAQSASDDSLDETYAMVVEFMDAERDMVLEAELDLSRRQGNRFWPIYEEYRADIAAIQERYAELVSVFAENYSDLSDELARELIGDYLAIESDLIEVRQRYVPQFLGAIPAAKLARFYQVENKIDTVAGLELALQIPLAGDD